MFYSTILNFLFSQYKNRFTPISALSQRRDAVLDAIPNILNFEDWEGDINVTSSQTCVLIADFRNKCCWGGDDFTKLALH